MRCLRPVSRTSLLYQYPSQATLLSYSLARGPTTHLRSTPPLPGSPTGTYDNPYGALNQAMQASRPGDTIFLLPGRHQGSQIIKNIQGLPRQTHFIITAYDVNNIPIIDAMASASNTAFKPGIALDSCSWIHISAIKFENCWNSVIDISQSAYISVQYCHFTTGKWVVHPHGTNTHHTLVEHCVVHHPPSSMERMEFGWKSHHGVVEYYNGCPIAPRVRVLVDM